MNYINVDSHLKHIDSLKDSDAKILKLKDVINQLRNELDVAQVEAKEWCIAWEEIFDVINNNYYVYIVQKYGNPISFGEFKKYKIDEQYFTPSSSHESLPLFNIDCNNKIYAIGEYAELSITDDQLVQTYIMKRVFNNAE